MSAELSSDRSDGADDHAVVPLRFSDGTGGRGHDQLAGGIEPTWDLQAASDAGVVRLELIPEVLVESTGPRRHPAVDRGG